MSKKIVKTSQKANEEANNDLDKLNKSKTKKKYSEKSESSGIRQIDLLLNGFDTAINDVTDTIIDEPLKMADVVITEIEQINNVIANGVTKVEKKIQDKIKWIKKEVDNTTEELILSAADTTIDAVFGCLADIFLSDNVRLMLCDKKIPIIVIGIVVVLLMSCLALFLL